MPAVLEEAAKGDAVSAEESTFDEPAVEADAAGRLTSPSTRSSSVQPNRSQIISSLSISG